MIEQLLKKFTGLEFEKEYKFHSKRKWRFDYCNIETKTAIEIEGGAWTSGRHTRGKGFIGDMEKYNASIELGWVVLRYTPSQMAEIKTFEQIQKVCNNRK